MGSKDISSKDNRGSGEEQQKSNDILVSIVVPAYNAAAYLRDTIDSIVQDTYPHREIIIVNDGSTDDTPVIAQALTEKYPDVYVLHQQNSGVCRARNFGISVARGKYILPVDADDLLLPGFIEWAVHVMESTAEVKCCIPKAIFFGERNGEWRLQSYSKELLARKNMIPASALYRRSDWEMVGGYFEGIQAREDWEFWISLLKNGGEVVTSPEVYLKYRIHSSSKRIADRKLKHKVIDALNERHPEFFQKVLGGPLRYQRSWSRLINRLHNMIRYQHLTTNVAYTDCGDFFRAMPAIFRTNRGEIIYNRRNQLRRMSFSGHTLVVKAYHRPHFINQIVYGLFRPTKAKRAYDYAVMLRQKGIGSPEPVAYYTERLLGLFLTKSYFISINSELPFTYNDIIAEKFDITEEREYLTAIAETTASLHEAGMVHQDYSRGNILFGKSADGQVRVELIDLNRIRFHTVDIHEGCQNFAERLPANDQQRHIIAEVYANERHFDADECYRLMSKYNKEKQ
jgi:glycosyltransferase involved in cell wall biosynthesis